MSLNSIFMDYGLFTAFFHDVVHSASSQDTHADHVFICLHFSNDVIFTVPE